MTGNFKLRGWQYSLASQVPALEMSRHRQETTSFPTLIELEPLTSEVGGECVIHCTTEPIYSLLKTPLKVSKLYITNYNYSVIIVKMHNINY